MAEFHSVTLDFDKCRGCINCVKRCPTEAIRVKNGKAFIISERCIDCGECIRICPHHAKKAVYDKMSVIEGYEYRVALPAPSLYPQFNNLDSIDYVLDGLLRIGFDDVFEVAGAAELVSEMTRSMMKRSDCPKPLISNACPAIVKLIQVRFPKLLPHLHTLQPPVEVAARLARERAVKKSGLPADKIGVFFISPCPAKVTALRHPAGGERVVDGVLSISEVYMALLPEMKKIERPQAEQISGISGISWSYTGGEATALLLPHYLAADGIENSIKILDEIENDKLGGIDFVELDACFSGCVGGCLCIENPYIARTKVRYLRKYQPVTMSHLADYPGKEEKDFLFEDEVEYDPVLELASDPVKAMEIMLQIEEIEKKLPGIDCASCGSPTCACFAQDVATGKAELNDCVFLMKKELEGKLSGKEQNDGKATV